MLNERQGGQNPRLNDSVLHLYTQYMKKLGWLLEDSLDVIFHNIGRSWDCC